MTRVKLWQLPLMLLNFLCVQYRIILCIKYMKNLRATLQTVFYHYKKFSIGIEIKNWKKLSESEKASLVTALKYSACTPINRKYGAMLLSIHLFRRMIMMCMIKLITCIQFLWKLYSLLHQCIPFYVGSKRGPKCIWNSSQLNF